MDLRPAVLVVLVLIGPACASGSAQSERATADGATDASTGADASPPMGNDAAADMGVADGETMGDGSDGPASDNAASDHPDATGADATGDTAIPADTAGHEVAAEAALPPACTPAADDPSRAAQAVLGTPLPCSGTSYAQYVRFTTPASPGGGGYVVIRFTEVSTITTLDTFLYVGDNTGPPYYLFELSAGNNGDPLTYWFAAYPATSYVIKVTERFGGGSGRYTFSASYTPIFSALRANLTASDTPRLTVGMPVDDYIFRGYRTFSTDTWAWSYKVTLAQGPATVTLSNLSPDFRTQARMHQPLGGSWYSPFTPIGQDFTLMTGEPVAAGEYIVWVEAYMNPKAFGLGDTPSSFMTAPFKITVRQ